MKHRTLAALVGALALGAAVAASSRSGSQAPAVQSPFVDLTYEQALERACAEGRMLVLSFEADRALTRRPAERAWSDPRVVAWIEREAVALRLGLERDVQRAARLAVHLPGTVVFLDAQGREYGRTSVQRGPASFLQEALYHCSREAPVERVPPAFAGDPDDPMDRGRHGDALREAGFLEQALTEYLWCWDEGPSRSPAYVGVHGSFLLSDLRELARALPPAREAMETRRAALRERALAPGTAGPETVRIAMDLVALDRSFFEDTSRTVADFEAVVARGEELEDVRHALGAQIREPLLEARRYDLLLASNPDPAQGFERVARRLERRRARRDLPPEVIENAVSQGALWFEACAGVGRREDALTLADDVLGIDGGPMTWAELIRRCARAEAHELGRELHRRARESLPTEQLPAVETAVIDLR